MKGARWTAAALVAALLAAAGPAVAAMTAAEKEARLRFDEAELQYRAGHYAEALGKYQAGYTAMPLAGFLINIAQCQRRLGDLKTARATYREFVLVAPDSRLRPEVESLIQELDGLIADLGSGGEGRGAGEAGRGADVHASDPTAPPPISLAATAPASERESALGATPAPNSSAPVAKSRSARWWIWGGVAVAVIAGGIATGIALSSPGTETIHAGSLGTLSR